MLDVIVVGAGVAGLAAGISLRRAGHKVRIYERSALNNEVGAAINVPPNAARVLVALGLDPVAARFVTVSSIEIGVGANRQVVNTTPMGAWLPAVYGAPLYFAHRVDLHEALKKLARGEGVGMPCEIILEAEVVGYRPNDASIALSFGEVVKGDVVVAADGIHSIAVETVLGHPNPPVPQDLYNGCFRFLIPAADIEADPEAKWWNENSDGKMRIFMNGPAGNRLVSYPCRGNTIHNFVGMFHSEELVGATREDWLTPVDKSDLLKAFPDFHPGILAVLNKANEIKRWPLLARAPLPTWIKGNMVLAGDSAHPMLPHQGQGGAQGIEDGLALGLVLCGAEPDQVEARLKAYEVVRRERASAVQVMSNVGQDQIAKIQDEVAKYTKSAPKNPQEFAQYIYNYDIVKKCVEQVKALDPSFEIPGGFFISSPYLPESKPQ